MTKIAQLVKADPDLTFVILELRSRFLMGEYLCNGKKRLL